MISTDRSGEVGVRTTEQVKLSVEHADVAVMCLGLDATIEGEQGDAGNEYARKRLNLQAMVYFPVWNIRDDYERREDIPAGSSGAGSGTAL